MTNEIQISVSTRKNSLEPRHTYLFPFRLGLLPRATAAEPSSCDKRLPGPLQKSSPDPLPRRDYLLMGTPILANEESHHMPVAI